jgi:amino acid transporter
VSTDPGLRKDALGLAQAVAIGVAGTAPAYTIAASTVALVAAVGALAPASLFYCSLIMAGIAFAFVHLNHADPCSGASYTWVGRVLHPGLGFLCGWTVLVSSVLFTVSAALLAATATLQLCAPDLAQSKVHVVGVAALWLVAITLIEVRGMRLTGIVQTWITAIEIAVLAAITVVAFAKHGDEIAALLLRTSFAPTAFTPESFAAGAIIAVFFFWGWDATLNTSEETRHSRKVPGVAALFAIAIITIAFMTFLLVTLVVLDESGVEAAGPNVVFAVANKLLPRPWGTVAVLAVLLSSVGSLQVSLLQFARTLFAQSRAGDMHPRWSHVHTRWQTPHLATWVNTAVGLALLMLGLTFPSIDELFRESINAIGLEIAFYYGMAALACAWHFRNDATRSARLMIFAVVWPLFSALALWATAIMAARELNTITLVIGLGAIALGVLPLAWNRVRQARRL